MSQLAARVDLRQVTMDACSQLCRLGRFLPLADVINLDEDFGNWATIDVPFIEGFGDEAILELLRLFRQLNVVQFLNMPRGYHENWMIATDSTHCVSVRCAQTFESFSLQVIVRHHTQVYHGFLFI